MKIYFVRHGKTEWNLEGRFQGAQGDSPLLIEAKEELTRLGIFLCDIQFDAAFSSDLKRAIDSAMVIMAQNKQPVSIITTPTLREWHLGRLEGQKISIISAIYPQEMIAFKRNLAAFHSGYFGAETPHDTTRRIQCFLQSLANKDYQNILIVGHGANLTASIRTLLGYDIGEIRQNGGLDNASLTILETTDFKHYDCLTWNDKTYLEATEIIT
ncbi:histidine phosphatase family protein [Streptococcus sciuri]|uniref:Histidine phosphatase family protein n=1 Tax=Streptococcus sciuri TaxID=2973939 RepID=A0ABT2FA52_9STRE|nr:histidine phosphatase family protein [Streptococcus sciuri]MCS4488712.1 histidine phosphatase family protein [Streptococcus sciuri]